MFVCPNCGELLPDDAKSCPYCGSDEETGWKPDAEFESLELPEEEPPGPTTHTGLSTAFSVFLLVVAVLGIVAIFGLRALASPWSLLGGLMIAVVILSRLKHKRGSKI